jgi:hypothetical protein
MRWIRRAARSRCTKGRRSSSTTTLRAAPTEAEHRPSSHLVEASGLQLAMLGFRSISVAVDAATRAVGLAVIALPCMLSSKDLTVLNLAVPRLSADLRPSSAQLLWIIDIYGFLLAGSLIDRSSRLGG